MGKIETYDKLRDRILDKFENYGEFAEAIGKSRQIVSLKLCGKCKIKRSEKLLWAKILDIPQKDIPIFFDIGV